MSLDVGLGLHHFDPNFAMNTQYYDSPAFSETITVLKRGLIGLVELPAILSRIDSLLETLTVTIRSNKEQMTELAASVEEQNRLIRHLGEKQECLEHAGKQQTVLTDQHYTVHVIEPMCRQLFPVIDHIRDALAGEHSNPNSRQHLRALQAQLLELLCHFGVESFESAKNDVFDPATMSPADCQETPNTGHHGSVAGVIKLGFRRGTTLLRPQTVSVFSAPTTVATNHISLI